MLFTTSLTTSLYTKWKIKEREGIQFYVEEVEERAEKEKEISPIFKA